MGKGFIAADLTRKQQDSDKILREKLKEFRAEGHSTAKINIGKIIKKEQQGVVVLYPPSAL